MICSQYIEHPHLHGQYIVSLIKLLSIVLNVYSRLNEKKDRNINKNPSEICNNCSREQRTFVSLYVNFMLRYHSLCEPCTPDPSQMYVTAKETTQHTPLTSDTRFQCIEREGTRMRRSSCCGAVYIE